MAMECTMYWPGTVWQERLEALLMAGFPATAMWMPANPTMEKSIAGLYTALAERRGAAVPAADCHRGALGKTGGRGCRLCHRAVRKRRRGVSGGAAG